MAVLGLVDPAVIPVVRALSVAAPCKCGNFASAGRVVLCWWREKAGIFNPIFQFSHLDAASSSRSPNTSANRCGHAVLFTWVEGL